MINSLGLIPALPFASFLILSLFGARMRRTWVALIGAGSVGLSAVLTLIQGAPFLFGLSPVGNSLRQELWTWIDAGGFQAKISFNLDPLSLTMALVVTVVAFLIHLYSWEYMEEEEGFSRFFAYMNLFVGSMLTLILANDLLLLYLGWEGVGLCSYLLIGFWYRDPKNGAAARKAFIVTRVGDAAMALGLFLWFNATGTLQIQEAMQTAATTWPVGSKIANLTAVLLLAGAIGKSAQIPLQTWLPDAMAGPTPVSALIHAATMVTAGVYLIARTHILFEHAPMVMLLVAVIGAATLLISGLSAITQTDIKRVLAYSTISQIGYMFLALGVGAWSAAIFHLVTHAFFKALLFLGAGVVIMALDDEHNIFKMGGLRRQLPLTFWTFLSGAASLAALPLVTAGFYSKDLILASAQSFPRGGQVLWAAGMTGALVTSIYIFRVVFIVFFGESRRAVEKKPGWRMEIPLFILGILSLVGGFIAVPNFLKSVFPEVLAPPLGAGAEIRLSIMAGATSVFGICLAYLFFLRQRSLMERINRIFIVQALRRFWLAGWGFDWFYNLIFVRPYLWAAEVNRNDLIDLPYRAISWLSQKISSALSRTENGSLRWYAAAITAGAVIITAFLVFS